MTDGTERRWGWLPDVPDARDFPYGALRAPARRRNLEIDLRERFSAVEDQGALGSCTACALAGALELLDRADGGGVTQASRLQIYYDERLRMGLRYKYVDSGAYLRDGVKVCAKGYADEALWPYVERKFADRPGEEAREDARKRRLDAYYRIGSLDELRDALAAGVPVVFGFSVYEGFSGAETARTGVAQMPKRGERMVGGHAVCAAGCSDSKGALLVRNSWGPAWGMGGYFWLPYGYAESRELSDDFWALARRKGEA